MNPFVFIVGCARSGTTLLQRIVNAHPDIAIIHETHWIPDFFEERRGLTSDGLVTSELAPGLLEYRRFAKLKIGREELEQLVGFNEPVSYARFVTHLFDRYGHRKGKRLVGDKTPRYVEDIPTLHALWARAKFVHLMRDGRDVALSLLSWEAAGRTLGRFATWTAAPVSTAAVWWEWKVRLGREARAALGPDLYFEIRYEALVTQPEEECAKLCAFLGVPYDEAMLRFHEGRTRTEPGLDAKRAWQPMTPGLRDWRTQMAPEDVEQFEAAAGDLLEELGYPRAVPRPQVEARQHAAMIRDAFVQEVRSRGDRLPDCWSAVRTRTGIREAHED